MEEGMPEGTLVDEIRTKYNKWSIYKVHEPLSLSPTFRAYKNGSYAFNAKDLRWVVDECNKRDR